MIELSELYQLICFSPQANEMAKSYWTNTESTQNTTKIFKIARENPWASNMAQQSAINLQFFNKCDFGPIQHLFNDFSPFHLPEARSISVDRAHLVLSSGWVVWKNNRQILSFCINSGYFWSKIPKNIKTLKNSMKLDRNEGFEHEKPYYTPPEYPVNDSRI
jgi:hypothetical protein